jgi:hypothetical protein
LQIGGKGIENPLVNMVLGKKNEFKEKFKKTHFHAPLIGNGLNIFLFGFIQVTIITYDLCNLNLSYLNGNLI